MNMIVTGNQKGNDIIVIPPLRPYKGIYSIRENAVT